MFTQTVFFSSTMSSPIVRQLVPAIMPYTGSIACGMVAFIVEYCAASYCLSGYAFANNSSILGLTAVSQRFFTYVIPLLGSVRGTNQLL